MCSSTGKPLKPSDLDLACSLLVAALAGRADLKAQPVYSCLASITRNMIIPQFLSTDEEIFHW